MNPAMILIAKQSSIALLASVILTTTGMRAAAQYYPPPYPYPGTYYQNPYNGYLTGAASVTSANGQYQNQIQQARLSLQPKLMVLGKAQSDTMRWYDWKPTKSLRPTSRLVFVKLKRTTSATG